MLATDQKNRQAFVIVYVDGALQFESSTAPNAHTLSLMQRCIDVLINGRSSPDPQQMAPAGSTHFTGNFQPQSPAIGQESPVNSAPQADSGSETDGPWLSDLIDEWGSWEGRSFSSESWTYSYAPTFRVFRELIGQVRRDRQLQDSKIQYQVLDIQTRQLKREHIQEFHAGLKSLPPRQGKRNDGIEAAERVRRSKAEKLPAPSADSIVKKLTHIKPFLDWLHRRGLVSQDVVQEMALALQAASNTKLSIEAQSRRPRGYVAFNPQELKQIFEQPAFLEGAMRHDWSYWVPLLCLYLGLRVNEASQLYSNDLLQVDSIWCLSVVCDGIDECEEESPKQTKNHQSAASQEEYRRLKNMASRRTVPLHPRLIELGFVRFIQDRQRYLHHAVHLFPRLKWEAKSVYGRKPSEHLGALIRSAGAYVPRQKVPHSLRSNFNQELAKTGIPNELHKRLLGHSTGDIKDRHYNETDLGPAVPAARVLEYLSRVQFDLKLPTWEDVSAEICRHAKPRRSRPTKSSQVQSGGQV